MSHQQFMIGTRKQTPMTPFFPFLDFPFTCFTIYRQRLSKQTWTAFTPAFKHSHDK